MNLTDKFVVIIDGFGWPLDQRHVTLGGRCQYIKVPDKNLIQGERRLALYDTPGDAFSAIANWRAGGNTIYGVVRASDVVDTVSVTTTAYRLRGQS